MLVNLIMVGCAIYVSKGRLFRHIRIQPIWSVAQLSCIKKYLSHMPKENSDNAFYLRALHKLKGDVWYYRRVMGRESLGNVVKNITRKAGFEAHFTNHSLWRSFATRLYEGGVPEQVIVETTGHRSCYGVREYKCTSLTLKREASKTLQGGAPKKVEMAAKEIDEKVFCSDVEQKCNEEKRLSKKVFEEKAK